MNPLSVIILDARLEYKKGTEFTDNVSNSKRMNLKLMVQKSTKKLLYAEAEEDFVDSVQFPHNPTRWSREPFAP